MVVVRAGKLNRRITLQEKTTSTNAYGERVDSWVYYASVWAKIEPSTSRESERAKSFGPSITHTITIRQQQFATPDMRVLYGDRVFLINGIIREEEAGVTCTLFCTELGAGVQNGG